MLLEQRARLLAGGTFLPILLLARIRGGTHIDVQPALPVKCHPLRGVSALLGQRRNDLGRPGRLQLAFLHRVAHHGSVTREIQIPIPQHDAGAAVFTEPLLRVGAAVTVGVA